MSNRIERHDKIQQITAKLIELNNNFANAPQLATVDIDLLKKYTVDLYDEILLLEPVKATLQANAPTASPKPITPEVKEETVNVVTPTPEPVKEKEIPQPPPTVEEKKEEPIVVETSKEEPKQEEPKPIEVEQPKAVEPVAPLQDDDETKEAPDNSLNTSLQQPEVADLASKLGQTPIHDLKKAISINKKFEFISQLFDGDHEGYTKSVHYINGLTNKEEAMDFFNKLKAEQNWDEENKRYIEFADLVSRRFM